MNEYPAISSWFYLLLAAFVVLLRFDCAYVFLEIYCMILARTDSCIPLESNLVKSFASFQLAQIPLSYFCLTFLS